MVKNEFTSEQNKYTTRSIRFLSFSMQKIKQLMHQSHETTQEDYKSFGKVCLQKTKNIYININIYKYWQMTVKNSFKYG